jgi:hypothetical protein
MRTLLNELRQEGEGTKRLLDRVWSGKWDVRLSTNRR